MISEKSLKKCRLSIFDSRQTGDILSVVSNDVDVVTNSIQQSLINIISSFFSILGIPSNDALSSRGN